LGLGPLQSSLSFASARPSLLRHGPSKEESRRSRTLRVCLSWGSCSPGHNYAGCPFSVTRFLAVAREGRGSPDPRRCRPQGSCPSRRFRLARGSLEVFWTPPIAVAPCASRPSFMPLASLELPSRAFPSRGAVPALAGRCFLAGSYPTAAGAVPAGSSRPLSRFAPARCHSNPPEGGPGTHEPGRRFSRSLVRSPRRTRRCAARAVHSPPTLGSPVNGRHARFEALLPPGVRSATTPPPGQARAARRCSPGVYCPSELSPLRFRVRSLASTRAGGKAPCHARLRAPSRRGCMPRPGLRRLGSRAQDPSIRRVYRTPRITVERRPSSPRASRALPCASHQPRLAPCRALKDGASCSCPLFGGTPRLPALGRSTPL